MTKARENSDYTGLQGDLALKSPVASPVFTGNVGVGATPESTNIHSSYTSVDISRGGAIAGHSAGNGIKILGNAYRTTSGYAYKNTDKVSLYANDDGIHQFAVAASGTADAAISWNTAMMIDNAGRVTKPLQPAFLVSSNAEQSIQNTAHTYVDWQVEEYDINSDCSSGVFTAPVDGTYFFYTQLRLNSPDNAHDYIDLKIETPNRDFREITDFGNTSADPQYWTVQVTAVARMDAGDTARARVYFSGGDNNTAISSDTPRTYFTGYLVA